MNERGLRDELFAEFARIGKCLSSPKRIELLDMLAQGPKSVEALAKATAMSIANVSQHLQTLSQAKLVRSSKRGNFVIYALSDPSVLDFLQSLYGLSEDRSAEVRRIKEQFERGLDGSEGITPEELEQRLARGEVTLLDVRPRDEYEYAHIPGAVSIPIEELAQQLSALPAHTRVVAYCRGPYCLMAARAIELLRAEGFEASKLDHGVNEWNRLTAKEGAK